ncbi:MAG: hypothetical protein WCO69_04370 [Candidatus Omnitrophota bacterium]
MRKGGVCFVSLLLAGSLAGYFSGMLPAQAMQRDDIISLALDTRESGVVVENAVMPPEDMVVRLTQCVRHAFSVAYEFYGYNYQEFVAGAKFMNNKGAYSGLDVEYAYHPEMPKGFAGDLVDGLLFQGRFAVGQVDYTGSGNFSGIDDHMYELRALLTKTHSFAYDVSVTPFLGIGYRYLNDGLEQYTPGGYNRESRYLYVPLGVGLAKKFGDGWSLAMNLEYDHLIDGEQQSHLEDVDPTVDTAINKQRTGYGVRASFKVAKDLTHRLSVFVEPFFRFWSIEKSDIKLSGYEPKNTTREVGLKVGVGF